MKLTRILRELSLYNKIWILIIKIDNDHERETEIEIIDVSGHKVYSKNIGMTMNTNETIDISDYPVGAYFVIIRSGKLVKVRKLILER